MSSMIVLVVVGLALLFVLALGVGLLVFVLKRGKKTGLPLPSPPAPEQFGGERRDSAPIEAPWASAPVDTVPPAPAVPQWPPAAPPVAPPATGPRTEAIDPAMFETQRTDDRPSGPASQGTVGLPARDTSELQDFRTIASHNPIDDYAPLDLFATTPNTPPDYASPEPAAEIRDADGAVTTIGPSGIKIGRHPDCDCIIPTPGASRTHAQVVYQDGGWAVEDLNSGNGTYVNGVRVRTHRLSPGDEIRIDQSVFTFGAGR